MQIMKNLQTWFSGRVRHDNKNELLVLGIIVCWNRTLWKTGLCKRRKNLKKKVFKRGAWLGEISKFLKITSNP